MSYRVFLGSSYNKMQKFKNKSKEILIDVRNGKYIFPNDYINLDLGNYTDKKFYDIVKSSLEEEVIFFGIDASIEKIL